MDFDKERLMMSEDEVRERARELLNESHTDLLAKYMFLEQKIQKQKEIIDEAIEYIKKMYMKKIMVAVIIGGKLLIKTNY